MAEIWKGAAANWIAREYAGRIEEVVKVQNIGATQVRVAPNDPERMFLLFVNLSTNLMYLGFDEAVDADKGIFLAANGGSYSVNIREDMTIPTYAHHVIAAGANSPLYMVQLRRFKGLKDEEVPDAN